MTTPLSEQPLFGEANPAEVGGRVLPRALLWTLFAAFAAALSLVAQVPHADELRAAAAAEKAGHYEDAAKLYQQFLAGTDSSQADVTRRVEARTRLATDYFLLHRYRESSEAVALLTSGGSPSTRLPEQAWLVQGLDQIELGQLTDAAKSLRRALALNPASATARLALGDALARSGRLEEAAREYEEQTERTPAVPDAWYKLGLAYARLSAQAVQDLNERDPHSAVGQQLAAEDLFDKGDTFGTAGALFRLQRQTTSQPGVQAELGVALFHLSYPKAAENHFRGELLRDPYCPLARLGLAETAALRGDWSEAISRMDNLASLCPVELARLMELPPAGPLHMAWNDGKIPLPAGLAKLPAAKLWRAWLNDRDSDVHSALEGIAPNRSCSIPPSEATTTPGLWLPEACYKQLRDRLTAKNAPSPNERIKLAECEFRLGHYLAARREAQRALRFDPHNEWGVYWLSHSEAELAQDCFAKVTSLNPDSARVHEMLAHYYAGRRQFARAKTEYQAAIRSDARLPDLHLGLATLYLRDAEFPEAEKELQTTLDLAPGSAVAYYLLGDICVQQQRWEPAIEHLRRALGASTVDSKARLDLARAHAEMGQTRQAIEDLLPALKNDTDGDVHYRLASLYRKLGDTAKAREALAGFKQLRDAALQADRADLDALEEEREKVESPHSAGNRRN